MGDLPSTAAPPVTPQRSCRSSSSSLQVLWSAATKAVMPSVSIAATRAAPCLAARSRAGWASCCSLQRERALLLAILEGNRRV